MPFTRVGGISHVIGGGDCPRRHNSRIKGGDCPRLAKQSQLYSPAFYGMPEKTEESWYVGKYVTPMW